MKKISRRYVDAKAFRIADRIYCRFMDDTVEAMSSKAGSMVQGIEAKIDSAAAGEPDPNAKKKLLNIKKLLGEAGKLLLRFTGFGAMMRAWNILKKAGEFAKMYVKETGRNLFMVTGIEVIVKLLGGAINIAKSIRK